MKSSRLIRRYLYFFYYTKKIQIISRFISKFKRPLSHKYIIKKKYRPNKKYNYFIIDALPTYVDVSELLSNKFTFLKKTVHFNSLISWSSQTYDDLWNFHLNYFDYLTDLFNQYNDSRDLNYILKGQELIEDWIKNSYKYNKLTWSPYTISLRLLNWISFYSQLMKDNQINSIPISVIESIKQQNNFLKLNLEYDVLGNHLFENVKTIILVEYFLGNLLLTKKYINKLSKILSKQILKDGCHFEKSISYHLIVMHGIVDIIDTLKKTDLNLKSLAGYIKLMHNFYNNISYSEMDYPLFNDSNYTMTERIIDIDKKIKRILSDIDYHQSVRTLHKTSGYFIHKSDSLALSMDLGDLGPKYLLAHAHNDIFNFELLFGDKKFVIDTGVYEYNNSEKRDYSRSTKAHNTIQVAMIEQSDIWGSFRVAYRPTNIYSDTFAKDGIINYFGSYKHKKKYIHHRNFIVSNNNSVVINDKINSIAKYDYKSFLHLHPEVLVKDYKNYFLLSNKEVDIYLYTFSNYILIETDKLEKRITKYYPHFGIEVDRQTIINENNTENCGFIFSVSKIKQISFITNEILINYESGAVEKMELNK